METQVGKSGPEEAGRAILSVLFAGSGLMHLVTPRPYLSIMPAYLPSHEMLVAASGVAEIAGGLGLLIPPTRRVAGWGLIALLCAVFPANIEMLRASMAEGASNWVLILLWLRLPLQPGLIWWVWRVMRLR